MKTLNVPDMHCSNCKNRIEKALSASNIAHQIDLENKTVSVDETRLNEAIETLEDLGFDID